MKRKKELLVVLTSLLVIVLSVTVAYFSVQIIGEGKELSVSTANLQIIYEDTDGSISGSNIIPPWSSAKTFKVTNSSDATYEYDIIIEDLVNTFVLDYLEYKITSSNGGYNMTEYKPVPKSASATDTVLVNKVSIDEGEVHNYTIEFRYRDEDVDQSEDMGKTLSGRIMIQEGTSMPTLNDKLLADNPTRYAVGDANSPRSGFDVVYEADNVNTLFTTTATEDGSSVYYFAGNAQNNWVKLATTTTRNTCTIAGKAYATYWTSTAEGASERYFLNETECEAAVVCDEYGEGDSIFVYKNAESCTSYNSDSKIIASNGTFNAGETRDALWRIIRTNEDGSIRLLYSGSGNKDADYNLYGVPAYCPASISDVSYMYGNSYSDLSILRENTYSSPIKNDVDIFYQNVIGDTYDKYVSKTAIYCSDRSLYGGSTLENLESFGSYERISKYSASYKCGANTTGGLFETTQSVADKFSVSTTSGGNGDLKYPAALMTADEVVFAGGKWGTNSKAWYTHDIKGDWYTMSMSSTEYLFGIDSKGRLTEPDFCYSNGIRPVLSLKSCVNWVSGNGSETSPYVVSVSDTCALAEN